MDAVIFGALAVLVTVVLVFLVLAAMSAGPPAPAAPADTPSRAGLACPRCGEPPPLGAFWKCRPDGCGKQFDTFATRGRCPACDKQWERTACGTCRAWSPHADWYVYAPVVPPREAAGSPQVSVERAPSLQDCPFCRDAVDRTESVACAECLARHHRACWDEHGACAACASRSRYGPVEDGAEPPAGERRRDRPEKEAERGPHREEPRAP